MSYSVDRHCASCGDTQKMYVAGSHPLPMIPGDFLCTDCGLKSLFMPGTHGFWTYGADANGDVDMISCWCCGRIYWSTKGPHAYQGVLVEPIALPAPTPKEGFCTSCGRELCEALDADYLSPAPLTRCKPCRNR